MWCTDIWLSHIVLSSFIRLKTVTNYILSKQIQTTITIKYAKDVISQASKNTYTVDLAIKPRTHTHTHTLMTSKQSSKRRGGLSGVFAFQINSTSNGSIMIPTYMHRLKAWHITPFSERQKSNMCYKNSFLQIFTYELLVVVKGEAQCACC